MSNAAKSAAAVAPSILEVELPVNFELCIKCQNAHGVLIANPLPGSYEKFLAAVRRRSSLGDTSVSLVHSRLSNFTANDLLEHRATWHTSCYKEVVHVGEIKRVENALKKKLSDFPDKVKLPDTSVQVTNTDTAKVRCFTRSLCQPLNTDAYFFCNEGPEKDALHEVTSFNVGKQIHEAVALSENSEWKFCVSFFGEWKKVGRFEVTWGPTVVSWGLNEVSWGLTQVSWGRIEVSWDLTQVSWGRIEVSWGLIQVSWGRFEVTWGLTEVSWGLTEVSWGLNEVC